MSEKLKQKLRFHKTLNSLWADLDETFLRPDRFIEDLLHPLIEHKAIKQDSLTDLEDFYSLFLSSLAEAEDQDMQADFLTMQNISLITGRLPERERRKWYTFKSTRGAYTRMGIAQAFEDWVNTQYRITRNCVREESRLTAEAKKATPTGQQMTSKQKKNEEWKKKKKEDKKKTASANAAQGTAAQPAAASASGGKKARKCLYPTCQEEHPLWKCSEFNKLAPVEKVDLLQRHNRCLFCYNHPVGLECFRHTKKGFQLCGVNGCNEMHHATLHDAVKKPAPAVMMIRTSRGLPDAETLWRPMQRLSLYSEGSAPGCPALVMFDAGSDCSLVRTGFARKKRFTEITLEQPMLLNTLAGVKTIRNKVYGNHCPL